VRANISPATSAKGQSSLDYAHARYYASSQGRFTSPDPLAGSASTANPQTFNRYSYVNNSPLTIVDPSGMFGICPGGGQGGMFVGGSVPEEEPEATGSTVAHEAMHGNAAGAESEARQQTPLTSDSDVGVTGAFMTVPGNGPLIDKIEIQGQVNQTTNEVTFRVPDEQTEAFYGANFFTVTLNLQLPKGTTGVQPTDIDQAFRGARRNSKGDKHIQTADMIGGSRVTRAKENNNNFYVGSGTVTVESQNLRERTAAVSFEAHYKGGGESNRLNVLIVGNTKNGGIKTVIPVTFR